MKQVYEQYNSLTDGERRYLRNHPHHALTIRESRNIAYAETSRIFGRNGRNDASDAFRHCFWSSILSRDLGYDNALEFTNAHEEGPLNPTAEKEMDLSNNAVGLELGKLGGDNRHLSSLCVSALLNKRLSVIAK